MSRYLSSPQQQPVSRLPTKSRSECIAPVVFAVAAILVVGFVAIVIAGA